MVRILKKDVRYNKAGHPRSSPFPLRGIFFTCSAAATLYIAGIVFFVPLVVCSFLNIISPLGFGVQTPLTECTASLVDVERSNSPIVNLIQRR
ncbi:MAG: hypothetical protein LBQ66_05195 [Planctomycetaceae bacterium]|nr:hypothetical protein [Planctomycetaceae bacterium]